MAHELERERDNNTWWKQPPPTEKLDPEYLIIARQLSQRFVHGAGPVSKNPVSRWRRRREMKAWRKKKAA